MRWVSALAAATLIAAAISVMLPLPAHGCSCATPSDLNEWVDQSEAVFVGRMVDRVEAGQDPFGGPTAIYVFEVETWVKGDLGDTIEVHSAADGAGCGFEFWDPDMRTGAAIWEEAGVLNGGLCSQVDADALLAAMEGPTMSETGVPKLIVANGWTSTRLTVLDENGHHVTELRPPIEDVEWSGTQKIDICPGEGYFLQMTEAVVVIWDMLTLESVATHELPQSQTQWPSDVSCRTEDASSIWVVFGGELDSSLVEIVGEPATLIDIPGVNGVIGTDFVVFQSDHNGDAIRLDLETGEETALTENAPNSIVGISAAPHPSKSVVAVLETRYPENGRANSEITVFDEAGEVQTTYEVQGEGYWPVWLDENRLAVSAQVWDGNDVDITAHVFDVSTGSVKIVEGWTGNNMVADDGLLVGVDGGTIVTADLASGELTQLVTIASQQAGPIVLLDDAQAVDPPDPAATTSTSVAVDPAPTTPPLVAPELGSSNDAGNTLRWIAGGAIVVFLGILVWLGLRKPADGS